jgi:hypothetical protein
MKKLILSLSLLSVFTAHAGVITCSNNVNSPGQYTDLQDAVDNSQPNDTILVHGSSIAYSSANIYYHGVTIIGSGYNNPNGENTTVNGVLVGTGTEFINGGGTKLIGLRLGTVTLHSMTPSGNSLLLENIEIKRCEFFQGAGPNYYKDCCLGGAINLSSQVYNYTGLFKNISIRNCLFSTSTVILNTTSPGPNFAGPMHQFDNFVFENNIFDSEIMYLPNTPDQSGLIFRNNIFQQWPGTGFIKYKESGIVSQGPLFENNIFHATYPAGCMGCTFNNNITFQCDNDTLIYSLNPGSSGGGNIIGQDPLRVNYPITHPPFNYAHDYNLQAGSPAIGAGSNGTDIGIYGGTSPFIIGDNPAIPQMEEVTTPLGSTVSQGTNLNVTFKSYKQD